MFETMAQFVLSEHMQGETFDPPTSGMGYGRTLSPQRRPYETLDGYVAVLPYNDGQWRRFFEAIGKADLLDGDPRFKDMASRSANIDSLYDMIAVDRAQTVLRYWNWSLSSALTPTLLKAIRDGDEDGLEDYSVPQRAAMLALSQDFAT